MLRKIIFLVLALSLCLTLGAFAQSGEAQDDRMAAFDAAVRTGKARPFIEFSYGQGKPQFEGLGADFATVGMMELKLGYADIEDEQPGVVSLMETYVFGTSFSEDLGSSVGDGEVRSEFGRFGGGNRFGYGFQGKSLALDLYNQNSLNWTEVKPVEYDAADPGAQAIFDRYGDSYRFGQLMEAGVKLRFSRSLALSVGAEGAVILPRYVFWPWLGSYALYSGVQGAVEYFAGSIIESSPTLGPILYFVLKSGVSYAYYAGSQQDMNWPFDSETPLTIASFKVGATLKF